MALLHIADAFEQRAEEFVALECENTGKPIGMTRSEEIPAAARPDPLLRRVRAHPRGHGAPASTWPGTPR